MASGPYHTSATVESSDARPSTGLNCENPVSRAAASHCGSARSPSTAMAPSKRGMRTVVLLSRPL